MPIIDGQRVWAATDNAAFLDKQVDDTALGKITLANTDPASGLPVLNTQQWINHLIQDGKVFIESPKIEFDSSLMALVFLGDIKIHFKDTGAVNTIPASASPIALNDGESVYVTVNRNTNTTLAVNVSSTVPKDKDTLRFCTRIGDWVFFYDNTALKKGNRAVIGEGNLDEDRIPLKGVFKKGTILIGVTGTSVDISSEMFGKTPSTSQTQRGVVVNTPYNKATILQASGTDAGDFFKDSSGNIIYGRITESAGTWTLSFYVQIGTTETSYNFTTPVDIDYFYQELFGFYDSPVYNEILPSYVENITVGVIDATTTQKGKVQLSTLPPPPIGSTSQTGNTNATVANADHTHEGVHLINIDGTSNNYLGDVILKAGANIAISDDAGKIKIDNTFTLPLSAKGDILTHDGFTTQTLSVGTDGQVLTADSSAPLGVKWADITGGGSGGGSSIILRQLSSNSATQEQFNLFPVFRFEPLLNQRVYFILKIPFNYNPAKKIKIDFLAFANSNSMDTFSFLIMSQLFKKGNSIDFSVGGLETFSVSGSSWGVNRRLNELSGFLTSTPGQIGSAAIAPGDIILVGIARDSSDTEASEVYLIEESVAIDFNS